MPVAYYAELRMKDVNGRAAKTNWKQIDVLPNIANAIDALSYAGGQSAGILSRYTDVTQAPTAAPYQSVSDKAVISAATALTDLEKVEVPAPIAAIFQTDQNTVDLTNTLVIALQTAAAAVLSDVNGSIVTSFTGGKRNKRRRR
jgi:hypothetical protein